MLISCLTNTYGKFGPEAALRLLPEAGIHCLELPIKNAGQPSFFKETPLLTDASTPDDVIRVREQVEAAGMQLSSCNISAGNPCDESVVERTLRKIDLAAQLGVSRVVAGAGALPSTDAWPVLVRHMQRIGDCCADHQMLYCCETHPGVCQHAEAMMEFLERVSHPAIRINFDTGNIFYYNQQADLLSQMALVLEFIEHVHLKDTTGRFQDWHFPELGKPGAVDFVAVRQLLEGRPDIPCSLELEGIQGEPELTLEEIQQRVIRSMKHLADCGYDTNKLA